MVKFFNLKKSAFSLPEVLIVLGIIGVITVLMLTLIRPNDNIMGLQYKNAYRALDTAAYNVYEDMIQEKLHELYLSEQSKINLENEKKAKLDNEKNRLKNKSEEDGTNLTDEEIADLAKNNIDKKEYCEKITNYLNTTSANCSEGKFTATSGAKFEILDYIDNTYPKNRLIKVDINGSKSPNSENWSKNKPADILYIIVNEKGEAAPYGVATIDRRYISARVIYPDSSEGMAEHSNPMRYIDAQQRAYGGNQYFFDNYSIIDPEISSGKYKAYKSTMQQDERCVNSDGAQFAKCTLEIVY